MRNAFAVTASLHVLLLAACAEINPATVADDDQSGGDEGDGDDGGGPSPTGVGPDAGAPVEEEVCDYSGESTGARRVRVLYMVPSDRDEDPVYTANLEQAARHAQQWMRSRLGGTHFTLTDDVVTVAKTTHAASWYATNASGDDPNLYFWNNVLADAQPLGVALDDPDDVWLVYVQADPACNQVNYGTRHVAVFPENDLRGLASRARIPPCGGATDGYGRCRWVGGMTLLMAFAMGLPTQAGCNDADNATPCDDAGLTRYGYVSYPSANLTTEQLDYLSNHEFLQGTGVPACDLQCATAVD